MTWVGGMLPSIAVATAAQAIESRSFGMTGTAAIWHALFDSSRWMAWNLLLAIVPLGLSLALFQRDRPRSLFWWLGVLGFVGFLPNAPYILTDVIHLVKDIQRNQSLLINTLIIIPKYLIFMLIGIEAYVLSLLNLGQALTRRQLSRWVGPIELLLHGLSAIGIYLGRFERFNSWDLLTQPLVVVHGTIVNLADPNAQRFIVLMFFLTTGFYWLLKQITIALLVRFGKRSQISI
jgi:uncharacterized membrane protein